MEAYGLVAIIICCGLFADNLLIKARLKKLEERIIK